MASPFLAKAMAATTTVISFSSAVSTSLPRRFSYPSSVAFQWCQRISTVEAKIKEIFMPALSSTMTEGKIASWVKSEGDVLSKGENVIIVESNKADVDFETFFDGIIAAIVVPKGKTATVGAPIGLIDMS